MNTFLKSILICLAVGIATASMPAQAAPASQPAPAVNLTVAVLDFDTSSTSTPEMGKQIGEALMATLSAEDGFTMVDRASMNKTLQEHELSLTGLVKPEDAVRIGQLIGAKLLITGKAFTLDKNIYVTAKIIGTETSLVEGVLVKDKQDADVGDLVTKLAAKLAEKIRTKGPGMIAKGEPADPIPGLKAKLAGIKLPKIALNLTETHYSEAQVRPIDPAVETEMASVLKQLGFEVIDADSGNMADEGVDDVLKGEAFSEFAAHVGNIVSNVVSCTARLEIKLTDRKTNDILFTDRVTTRAADLSENIAAKTALQNAGHELALRLAQHFIDQATTKPAK